MWVSKRNLRSKIETLEEYLFLEDRALNVSMQEAIRNQRIFNEIYNVLNLGDPNEYFLKSSKNRTYSIQRTKLITRLVAFKKFFSKIINYFISEPN
jgi:hypothetical protein